MSKAGPEAQRVLCVAERRAVHERVRSALGRGVSLREAESLDAATAALARASADLVVCALDTGAEHAFALLERARHVSPGVAFALIGADATSWGEALRRGASEWIPETIDDASLAAILGRLLDAQALRHENVRLRHAVRTLESCRMLTHCLDPGEVYAVALDLLLPALGRDLGLALFRRSSMPGSHGIAFRGFDEESATQLQRVAQKKSDGQLFAGREATVSHGGPIAQALEELGVGAGPALMVPLHGAESEEGLLWVPEQGRATSASDLVQARMIATHAELALVNAERYHRAKERAFIDDVTEVYNARYLLQATEHEIHRADRSGKELSVLFLDLDRFKRVNDQYGHLVGSNVLRRLSEVLLECVRQVSRRGGVKRQRRDDKPRGQRS
jgi:GGDEF domain-containing protein